MTIGIDGDVPLSHIIRDFKRATARLGKVRWQRNFFDHRIRQDESLEEKEDYIRENPVRAGLIKRDETWPYVIATEDCEGRGD